MRGRCPAPRIGLWDHLRRLDGRRLDALDPRTIRISSSTRVFAPQLDAGNLNAKYDVLIFVDRRDSRRGRRWRRPRRRCRRRRGGAAGGASAAPNIPEEYRDQIGSISAARTIPQLKAVRRAAAGESWRLAARRPTLRSISACRSRTISSRPASPADAALPRTKYYVPGSVLHARVDTTQPASAGHAGATDFFFDNSPVWKLGRRRAGGRCDAARLVRLSHAATSGWAWGQAYLDERRDRRRGPVGKGRLLLYGPEILMRAQPHRTFKFLFNAIYWGQQWLQSTSMRATLLVSGLAVTVSLVPALPPGQAPETCRCRRHREDS